MYVLGAKAWAVGFDQKAADIVVFILYFGPDNSDVGDRARGDPHLLAVEDVFTARLSCPGAHAAGIGAEIRLGETEAPDLFAFLHYGKPGFLLLIAAKRGKWIHSDLG